MKWHANPALMLGALSLLAACGDMARLTVAEGSGQSPVLPPPRTSLLPTVQIAPAVGWSPGATPVPAAGLAVQAFATGLAHPRWLLVLPNGDVLVAETNAPERAQSRRSIRRWIMGKLMQRAGATVPSANRITLLRDIDGDGRADVRTVFIQGLNSPFGMALVNDRLYVANTDGVVHFPYRTGVLQITAAPELLADLPAGPLNHHWTKSLIAAPDGKHLYATVGSNSNVGENGLQQETGRAAIWEIDLPSGERRVFASGLRNPNGMAWEPDSGMLWTVVNERDELGSDLVPDYLTSVIRDGFYGWPYSYFGQQVDARVRPARADLVARAIVPDYALGPHTGSLGLASSVGSRLLPAYAAGMFVGQHGSWNRKPRSGYRVLFVPFSNGRPTANTLDVLTGFVNQAGEAHGRPVGVSLARDGSLLVADDVGDTVWRVTAAPRTE